MGGEYPSDNSDVDNEIVNVDRPAYLQAYTVAGRGDNNNIRESGLESDSEYDDSDQENEQENEANRRLNLNLNTTNSTMNAHRGDDVEDVEEASRIGQFETVANLLNYQKRVMYADCGVAFDLAVQYIETKEAQDFLDSCMYGVVDIFLQQKANTVRKTLLVHFEKVFSGAVEAAIWDLKTNNSIRWLKPLSKIFSRGEWFYSDNVEVKPIGEFGSKTRTRMIQQFSSGKGWHILHDMLKGLIPIKPLDASGDGDVTDTTDVTDSNSSPGGNNSPRPVGGSTGTNELSGEEIYLLFAPLTASYGDIPVEFVKSSADLVMKNLSHMSENMLKKQQSETLSNIHECLRTVLGDNNTVLKNFLMSLSLKTLKSKAFPLRKLGLDMINKFAVAADRHTRMSPRFGNGQSVSGVDSDEEAMFNEKVFKPWLLDNQVLESLFGSKGRNQGGNETHPVLVGRSKDLFYYMIRQDILLPKHIDMIFRSSIRQHESVRGAVQTLLAEIAMDKEVSDELASYILHCARLLVLGKEPDHETFICDADSVAGVKTYEEDIQLRNEGDTIDDKNKSISGPNGDNSVSNEDKSNDNDMMFFTEKLMRAEQQSGSYHQFSHVKSKTLSSLLELLWSLLEMCKTLEDPTKDLLMEYIVNVLRSTNALKKREVYTNRCIGILQAAAERKKVYIHNKYGSQDVIVFTAYEILRNIIDFYRTSTGEDIANKRMSDSEYNDEQQQSSNTNLNLSQCRVIEMLQQKHGLLELVVNETIAYVDMCSSSSKGKAIDDNVTEKVQGGDRKDSRNPSKNDEKTVEVDASKVCALTQKRNGLRMKALRGRLGFLRFCLGRSSLNLSFKLVDALWHTLVKPEEREMYLVWLRRVAEANNNINSSYNTLEKEGKKFESGLTLEVIEKVFTNLLCEQTIEEFKSFSEQGFRCFSAFFLDVNSQNQALKGESSEVDFNEDDEEVSFSGEDTIETSKKKKTSSLFGGFGFGKTSKKTTTATSNPSGSTATNTKKRRSSSASSTGTGTTSKVKPNSRTGLFLSTDLVGLETVWRIIVSAPQGTSLRAMKLLLDVQCRIEAALSIKDASTLMVSGEGKMNLSRVNEDGVDSGLDTEQVIDGNEDQSTGNANLCLQKRIEFLNKMFSLLSEVARADTVKVRRCVQLIMSYLEMFPLPCNISPHLRPLGNDVDLLVHHHMVLLNSKCDIGKMLQQVVPVSFNGTGNMGTSRERDRDMTWLRGIVIDYNEEDGTHEIWYLKTGKTFKQDMRKNRAICLAASSNNNNNISNGTYKMMRNTLLMDVNRSHHLPEQIQNACAAYQPFRISVKERITLKDLKVAILDLTGCRRNPRSNLTVKRMTIDVQLEHEQNSTSDNNNNSENQQSQGDRDAEGGFNSVVNGQMMGNLGINIDSDHVRRLTVYPDEKSICELLPANAAYTYMKDDGSGEHVKTHILLLEQDLESSESPVHNEILGGSNNSNDTFEFEYFGPDDELPQKLVTKKGSKYATLLMDLLDSESINNGTRIELWGLLMALPTDQTQMDKILSLGLDTDGDDNMESKFGPCRSCGDWEEYLGISSSGDNGISILRTVYLLMIADQMLFSSPSSSSPINAEDPQSIIESKLLAVWRDNFLNKGGFESVCKLLSRVLDMDKYTKENDTGENAVLASYMNWQQRVSIPVLVRIVKYGVVHCCLTLSKGLPGSVSFEFIMKTMSRVINLGYHTSIANRKRRKVKNLMLKRKKTRVSHQKSLIASKSSRRNHRYHHLKHGSKHPYSHDRGSSRRVSFSDDFNSFYDEDDETGLSQDDDEEMNNKMMMAPGMDYSLFGNLDKTKDDNLDETSSNLDGSDDDLDSDTPADPVYDEDDAALRVVLDAVHTTEVIVSESASSDIGKLVLAFLDGKVQYHNLCINVIINNVNPTGESGKSSELSMMDILLLSSFSKFRRKLKMLIKKICDKSTVGCELVEKLALETLKTRLPIQCRTCEDFFESIANLVTCMTSTSSTTSQNKLCESENVRGRLFATSIAAILIEYPAPGKEQQMKEAKVISSLETPNTVYPKPAKKNPSQAYKTATQSLVDQTLIGLLQLLKLLFLRDKNMIKNESKFVELSSAIMSRYLLATPSAKNPDNGPVATLLQTREASFNILRIMADNCPKILTVLSEVNTDFVELMPIPRSRVGRLEWNFKSTDTKRAPFGFVGLVNEGATCYQNSVIQQLFMCPAICNAIRKGIGPLPLLSDKKANKKASQKPNRMRMNSNGPEDTFDEDGPDNDDEDENDAASDTESGSRRGNLLYALQDTLGFLAQSQRKCYNPIKFVNRSATLKLTDGHLRQNDAIEFYSRLIDYIEINLKDQNDQKDLLKNLLYVHTCTMNVRHCEGKHRTESEVGTPFLTLNIRSGMAGPTLHSLEEALDSWFKSEKLTGLDCEDCNLIAEKNRQQQQQQQVDDEDTNDNENIGKRYDADQIKCFSRLPPILVVQLQRFDFDFEMMQPTKLNHRVSFERRIDLGRFTKRAVMRKVESKEDECSDDETKKGIDEEDDSESVASVDQSESEAGIGATEYELRGVVVHQGSGANFGHYYSFIMDRNTGSWFRFDDERVFPFDVANLEEECFGGIYEGNSPGTGGWQGSSMTSQFSRSQKDNNAYLLLYERLDLDVNDMIGSLKLPGKTDTSFKLKLKVPATLNNESIRNKISFGFSALLVRKLQICKRKAQSRIQARRRFQDVQKNVWEDNQKTIRHGLVLSPDFLDFTLLLVQRANNMLGSVVSSIRDRGELVDINRVNELKKVSYTVIRMGVVTFVKATIRVASQKAKLRQWLPILKRLFFLNMNLTLIGEGLEENTKVEGDTDAFNACKWFLLHVSQDTEARKQWLKPLLTYCLEQQAREQFTQLFLYILALTTQRYKNHPKKSIRSAEEVVVLIRTLSELMPHGQCNCKLLTPYLRIWRCLVSLNREELVPVLMAPEVDLLGALTNLYISNDPSAPPMAHPVNSPGGPTTPNSMRMNMDAGNSPLGGGSSVTGMGGNPNQYADYEPLVQTISLLATGQESEKSNLIHEGIYPDVVSMQKLDKSSAANALFEGDEYFEDELFSRCDQQLTKLGFEPELGLCNLNLSERSKALFYSEEFYVHLSRRDPGVGSRILAVRCMNDKGSADAIVRELIDRLKCTQSTQSSVSTMNKDQIKDVCRALECILGVYDSYCAERTRFVVESLLKLCITCKKGEDMMVSAMNKGNMGGSGNVNIPYLQEERGVARATYLYGVYHIAKLFGNVFNRHELVRALLWKHREYWTWLPEWIDQHSYDPDLGGNPEVFTRSIAKGKTVRQITNAYYACHIENLRVPLQLQTILCVKVIVKGAGTEAVNGLYEFDGYFEPGASEQVDTVTPKWCKVTDGVRYTLYRCRVKDRNFTWYISNLSSKPGTNRDVDYYSSQKNQPNTMPPLVGWSVCKKASKPVPRIQIVRNKISPDEDPCMLLVTNKDDAGLDKTEDRQQQQQQPQQLSPAASTSVSSSPEYRPQPEQVLQRQRLLQEHLQHMQISQNNREPNNPPPVGQDARTVSPYNQNIFQEHVGDPRSDQHSNPHFNDYHVEFDQEPPVPQGDYDDDGGDSSSYSSSSLNYQV